MFIYLDLNQRQEPNRKKPVVKLEYLKTGQEWGGSTSLVMYQ